MRFLFKRKDTHTVAPQRGHTGMMVTQPHGSESRCMIKQVRASVSSCMGMGRSRFMISVPLSFPTTVTMVRSSKISNKWALAPRVLASVAMIVLSGMIVRGDEYTSDTKEDDGHHYPALEVRFDIKNDKVIQAQTFCDHIDKVIQGHDVYTQAQIDNIMQEIQRIKRYVHEEYTDLEKNAEAKVNDIARTYGVTLRPHDEVCQVASCIVGYNRHPGSSSNKHAITRILCHLQLMHKRFADGQEYMTQMCCDLNFFACCGKALKVRDNEDVQKIQDFSYRSSKPDNKHRGTEMERLEFYETKQSDAPGNTTTRHISDEKHNEGVCTPDAVSAAGEDGSIEQPQPVKKSYTYEKDQVVLVNILTSRTFAFGTVKYVGILPGIEKTKNGKNKIFYGIELYDPVGLNNGTFVNPDTAERKKCFRCKDKHGVFVKRHQIIAEYGKPRSRKRCTRKHKMPDER